MTSIELVDFINCAKEEGQPDLRHDHFMAKVPRVIGKAAPNFLGAASYANGSGGRVIRRIYTFPKREACLMAMSYSYELQALVFDKMTALEDSISSGFFSVPKTRADALRLAADLEEQNVALAIENHQQAEKIASLESIFQVGMTPAQFCKRLNGVNCQQVNNALLARKWIYNAERNPRRSVKYRVGSLARDKLLTEEIITITTEGSDPFAKYTPILLQEGAKRLHELYMAQKLPMKKTWDGQFCHCKATQEDLA